MKYFAKIELNNKVTAVLNVDDSVLKDADGNEYENLGVSFLTELTGWPIWKDKLGGTPFRKNYAVVGDTYDETRDAFIAPKPYASWTLNESTCQWEAPVTEPNDDKTYIWNESEQRWDEVV